MATHQVNLDALLAREDFEDPGDQSPRTNSRRIKEIRIEDMEESRPIYPLLRKPDFQRETDNWGPAKIADFIKSFLDGDFIPSLIMWLSESSGKLFVIDGAHRLSALMAWVHDDYGDGKRSREVFGAILPPAQLHLANATRAAVQLKIGTYADMKTVNRNQSSAPNAEMLRRSSRMATSLIEVQWVVGSAATAETSFFKINGNQTVVDDTEMDIIEARHKANAIATRALMRGGRGHKYWGAFPEDNQHVIEDLSREINDSLFSPILEIPLKTMDIPIAGQGYSAETFRMIFDLVNIFNDVKPSMWRKDTITRARRIPDARPRLEDDSDGSETILFLTRVRDVGSLISTDHKGSLGLHPAVYFWGSTGKFVPAAFLAALRFAQELKLNNSFFAFTSVRANFEEFLVRHRDFINQVGAIKGSRTRPLEALVTMYRIIFSQLKEGPRTDDVIIDALLREPQLTGLKAEGSDIGTPRIRKRFTKDVKTASFLRDGINSIMRCQECGARLHRKSMSSDHVLRVADGGVGDAENHQWKHPYCNTGYKNLKRHILEAGVDGVLSAHAEPPA